ncbi:glycosyltransferase family 2 protein [Acinetobacter radioresistens]|uniref:glycosyltransferase family 2 protein n=1 Tax=Acinetobacter radioresistens TaxID=40216 RepID=UPI000F77B57F|nr:glycosyltransferase family 2 protein [Acinetobacter radioresistens]MCU4517996.1 glycosyltransferase family 2 protein [Acinetobacter radioresistens]RSO66536.1 glycosyltransferase family 2 protein [Acinetobacter radioresistens]
MTDSHYITIGIPFYNAERYLSDAIKSVLVQSYPYWELILVDDGSSDKSLEIAKYYANKDSRIRVISDGKNKKLAARLNQIIFEAKYDFIARMDADDLMSISRLEKQIAALKKNPHINLVTTGCLTIGKENELTGVRLGRNIQMNATMILNGVTNLLHASMLARKEWCLRNQYNENRVIAQDYELWLSAAKKNDLDYIVLEEPLYWYRVVENVTYFKLIKGYNTQISVIENNYKNIISEYLKNKIIFKFNLKKLIVFILNKTNRLDLLLKRRAKFPSEKYFVYHAENLKKIHQLENDLS